MVCVCCGANPQFKGAECCVSCLEIYYPAPKRENIKEQIKNKPKPHTRAYEVNERRKRELKRNDEMNHTRDRCKLGVGDVNTLKNKDTCDTLKQHHNDLNHDPESLSTEFLQNLIGKKC